jgi:hypothetical protein
MADALRPPSEQLLDGNGNLTVAWLSYLQALADEVSALKARLAAASIP